MAFNFCKLKKLKKHEIVFLQARKAYTVDPPPKDSDFRRQILSLVRVLRHWLLFVYIY